MQVRVAAVSTRTNPDVVEPMKVADLPNCAAKHKKEMLRYCVLMIALLAVVLLIAIALYYTQGNSVTIEHVSALVLRQATTLSIAGI